MSGFVMLGGIVILGAVALSVYKRSPSRQRAGIPGNAHSGPQ
jgi:hypothetical protein